MKVEARWPKVNKTLCELTRDNNNPDRTVCWGDRKKGSEDGGVKTMNVQERKFEIKQGYNGENTAGKMLRRKMKFKSQKYDLKKGEKRLVQMCETMRRGEPERYPFSTKSKAGTQKIKDLLPFKI